MIEENKKKKKEVRFQGRAPKTGGERLYYIHKHKNAKGSKPQN